MGVSEKLRVPCFGVLIKRILLFRVLYVLRQLHKKKKPKNHQLVKTPLWRGQIVITPDGHSSVTEEDRAARTALRSLFKLWWGGDKPFRTVRRRMEVTLKVILHLHLLGFALTLFSAAAGPTATVAKAAEEDATTKMTRIARRSGCCCSISQQQCGQ